MILLQLKKFMMLYFQRRRRSSSLGLRLMEKVLLFTVVMKGVVRSLTLIIKFVTIARRRNASKRIATSCRIEIIGCNKEGKATKISSEANVAKNYYSDGEVFFFFLDGNFNLARIWSLIQLVFSYVSQLRFVFNV